MSLRLKQNSKDFISGEQSMNVYVLGGGGFIGSHIVKNFLLKGYNVTAFCRSPKKLDALKYHSKLKIVKGLMQDYNLIAETLHGHDALIHTALGWGESIGEMISFDTIPTVKIFEIAQNIGVKNLLFTSSVVALGEYRSKMNNQSVCLPIDAYGASKAAIECFLLALSREEKSNINIVRPVYTFGNPACSTSTAQPDQRIVEMIRNALCNKAISMIKNDGTQMLWVEDIVWLYEEMITKNINGNCVIAASKNKINWFDVAEYIIQKTESTSKIVMEDRGWKVGDCIYETEETENIVAIKFDVWIELKKHIDYCINREIICSDSKSDSLTCY